MHRNQGAPNAREMWFVPRLVVLLTLLVAAFWLADRVLVLPPVPHFLVWHNVLEITAVAVSVLIFAVGWNTHALRPNRTVLLLACGFLGVALLDFSHTLSYAGMPDYITANSVEKGINFWLAARYLVALTLLLVVVLPDARALSAPPRAAPRQVLMAATLALVLVLHVIFLGIPQLVPRTFVEGEGLTRFKVLAELGVIALHVVTALLLIPRFRPMGQFDTRLLFAAVSVMALSEVFFSLYRHHTDYFNLLGHVYKVAGYLLLYRAVFVEAIAAPYRALEQSERHLQALVNAIPDLIFEVDGEGRFLGVHALRQELLAVPFEDLVGKRIVDTLPEEPARIATTALAEAGVNGYAQSQPYALDLADGRHWFELSIARVPGSAGGHYVALARDISRRVRDQDTLRKLMHAVEQSPSVILITDLDGRIEFANPAFTDSTGYAVDEVMGANPRLLQSGNTPPETYRDLWRTLRDGHPWRGEFINRRKDGDEYIEAALISPIRDELGNVTHYMAIKQDITRLRAGERRIEELANFDMLTGLPNRAAFAARFQQALDLVERAGEPLALLFLDLDQFKNINDSLGHQVGDELLRDIAGRLQVLVTGDSATLSRQGGDEFLLLLPFTDARAAAHRAEQLLAELSKPCLIRDYPLVVTASIGIALYPGDGDDLETLARGADAAMYRAKQEGRNTYRFFSREMQAGASRVLLLENALRFALEANQLDIHYQPQVRIADGRIVGVEALLRWRHPELGMISPQEFIPIAEGSGQIVAIGEWVLRTAVRQASQWRAAGHPDLVVAVNLSLVQFRQDGLVALVRDALATAGLPAANLELELTESVAMGDPDSIVGQIGVLRDLGVRLAIDDFGTGYSSLSYLKRLRVDRLKIDQSFVAALDDNDRSIVQAVVSIARSLGLATLAEGVETPVQLAELRALGCDEAQGYLFSRPLPVAEVELQLRCGRVPA
ncbi:MAG TPA: EAL domain-containing protein [Porticoccaceae bacterium]|nr:EAL domain-containing protein [Porticoccaceae bacterium]